MKNKMTLLVCFLVVYTNLLRQKPEPTPLHGEQIIPLIRLYNLKELAVLTNKSSSVESKEVPIDMADGSWNSVPFHKILVADDYVALKSTDNVYYVVCPFPPPTLEKLSSARTYQEMLQTLIPTSGSGYDKMLVVMDVSNAEQTLQESHDSFDLTLRAAYFNQDRFVWIECVMTYQENKEARSQSSPFHESVMQIHISPKYK